MRYLLGPPACELAGWCVRPRTGEPRRKIGRFRHSETGYVTIDVTEIRGVSWRTGNGVPSERKNRL